MTDTVKGVDNLTFVIWYIIVTWSTIISFFQNVTSEKSHLVAAINQPPMSGTSVWTVPSICWMASNFEILSSTCLTRRSNSSRRIFSALYNTSYWEGWKGLFSALEPTRLSIGCTQKSFNVDIPSTTISIVSSLSTTSSVSIAYITGKN